MAMAHSILCSSPTIHRSLRLPIVANAQSSILLRSSWQILGFQSSPASIQCVRADSVVKRFRLSGGKLEFCVRAENGGGGEVEKKRGLDEDEEDEEFRGVSTSPDRFKFSVEDRPDPFPRWPLLVGMAFLGYAWRMVLWEVGNWRKALFSCIQFLGAIIDFFLGDLISITLDVVRSFYSSIVSYAPIPELTTIVMLASAVLAISESASRGSVASQPYLLTVSGLVGYMAVKGFISEPTFWLILFGSFGFARFIKKRDYVSSSLPVAVVLVSVGEPWVRVLAMSSFTALAICHHRSKVMEGKGKEDVGASESSWRRIPLPLPLMAIGLAIGMRLVGQWAGYRHLTWKIV